MPAVLIVLTAVICVACYTGQTFFNKLFSAAYWGDRLTVLQMAGIAVMLAAFVVLNGGGIDFRGVKWGYFFWVVSLFFTNGVYGVLMDAQQRLYPHERNEMIMVTFFSSGVVSLIYLFATQKKSWAQAFRMGKDAWGFAVGSGLCAAFAVYTLMALLAYIPGYILYTVCNGSVLVLSAVLCRIVLKENMTKMTVTGILLSAVSITMLSL